MVVMFSHRMLVIGGTLTILFMVLLASSTYDHGKIVQKIGNAINNNNKNNDYYNHHPYFQSSSTGDLISNLFESTKHPITAQTYRDVTGQEFTVSPGAPWWEKPLKNKVLILDIDTRVSEELWSAEPLDWEAVKPTSKGSAGTSSFMNHFLYAQVHGYDYRFFNAAELKDMHNTWVKPHVLARYLQEYQFVVFIDADATIQHLDVPLEWLFNRWGITNETSIAMPIDTRQDLGGNTHVSEDSKGNMVLNSGFIIAQAVPLTFDMMTAWAECPTEKRYEGCGKWKNKWSHEQRAFSEYIRYDFNPSGNNIVEIACDDAMGYPGLIDDKSIMSNCTGQFLRHHTLKKALTKKSAEAAMLQSLVGILHTELVRAKEKYMIKEN